MPAKSKPAHGVHSAEPGQRGLTACEVQVVRSMHSSAALSGGALRCTTSDRILTVHLAGATVALTLTLTLTLTISRCHGGARLG